MDWNLYAMVPCPIFGHRCSIESHRWFKLGYIGDHRLLSMDAQPELRYSGIFRYCTVRIQIWTAVISSSVRFLRFDSKAKKISPQFSFHILCWNFKKKLGTRLNRSTAVHETGNGPRSTKNYNSQVNQREIVFRRQAMGFFCKIYALYFSSINWEGYLVTVDSYLNKLKKMVVGQTLI